MDTTRQCPFSLHVCTHTETVTVHSPFTQTYTDVQAYLAHQNAHLKS